MEAVRNIPSDIDNLLHKWDATATWLHIITIILTTLGIVLALAVTGFTDDIGGFWTRVLAFISAVSFGLLNGLGIPTLASNFRSAWRHLNSACLEYKMQLSDNDSELIKAYRESESFIGHLVVSTKPYSNKDE